MKYQIRETGSGCFIVHKKVRTTKTNIFGIRSRRKEWVWLDEHGRRTNLFNIKVYRNIDDAIEAVKRFRENISVKYYSRKTQIKWQSKTKDSQQWTKTSNDQSQPKEEKQ